MRNYKRKTDRGTTPIELLQRAATAVLQDGRKIRSVAREAGICHVTLSRYIRKIKTGLPATMGYCPRMVFDSDQEKALAVGLAKYSSIYLGLMPSEIRKMTYNCAIKLKIPNIPAAWHKNQEAGVDWFKGFLKRNMPFSIRIPKVAHTGRAFYFNRSNISEFFTKLGDVIRRHNLLPSRIWNVDETEVTTFVPSPGVKQIDAIASMEQRTFVTIELAANAAGGTIPPMFVFPRLEYGDQFIRDGPPGSIGAGNSSGSMTSTEFLTFMDHFIELTKPSPEDPVLLLIDNHSSHVNVDVVEKAEENYVILLSFPTHCTHKLQPLELGVHGMFKTYYAKSQKNWLRNNPGKTISLFEIPEIVRHALPLSATPSNVINSFKKAGISPYNPDIFKDEDIPVMPDTHQETDQNIQPEVQKTIEVEVPQVEQMKAVTTGVASQKEPEAIYIKESQPGPSNTLKFSNNFLIPATLNQQELIKRKVLQDSDVDDDDQKKLRCIICLDPFSNSQPEEKWIECVLCKKWAHLECLESDNFHYYVCAFCDSDDEAFGKTYMTKCKLMVS